MLDVFHQLNIQKFLCRDLQEDISPVMRDGSNLTSFYSSPAGNVFQHTMSIWGIKSDQGRTTRQTACPIVLTEKSLSLSKLYLAMKAAEFV